MSEVRGFEIVKYSFVHRGFRQTESKSELFSGMTLSLDPSFTTSMLNILRHFKLGLCKHTKVTFTHNKAQNRVKY